MKTYSVERITRSDRQKAAFFSCSTLRAMRSKFRGFTRTLTFVSRRFAQYRTMVLNYFSYFIISQDPTSLRRKTTRQLVSGFTLIELLIVIALIGILATIVISNLQTARDKSMDAAAKETLASARTVAAYFYDDFGTYGRVSNRDVCCPASGGITCDSAYLGASMTEVHKLVTAAASENRKNAYCLANNPTGESYTAFVMLRDGMIYDGASGTKVSTKAFCIDSTGFAGIIPAYGNGYTAVSQSVLAAQGITTGYIENTKCQ